MAQIEGTEIVAICDLNPERIENSQKTLKNSNRKEAVAYTGEEDWKKMCERDDIDLIYNATPWELHVPIALYAMDHGKHVAIEVPAALTVKDCWALVAISVPSICAIRSTAPAPLPRPTTPIRTVLKGLQR